MVYKTENTEETLHEGYTQYTSWNISEIDTDTGCGFLVQEVNMVITIDMNTESTHYFEARKIEDGKNRTANCGEDNFNLLMNDFTNAVDRAVKDTGRTEYLDIVHGVKDAWNSAKAKTEQQQSYCEHTK